MAVGLKLMWRWPEHAFTEPILVPLVPAPSDSATRFVEVPIEARYDLVLAVDRGELPIPEVKRLLSDSLSDDGERALAVRWSLRDARGALVAAGNSFDGPVGVWSRGQELYRSIGRLELPPGRYRFQIRVDAHSEQLQGRAMTAQTDMAVKSGETAATGYAMLFVLLRWPFLLLLSLAIGWVGVVLLGSALAASPEDALRAPSGWS